ncbi:hypothetical protein RFI_04299 [Reticulomyxa filosa]|uniref:Uncharacterized protein n=1 Tax=Reticulomyxa filosa TaxID=46433 RepID=X6P400_RETFI|nr:hypothetical protein RFI_04299 [Reticulomyxa filosa]|eukprot:ETO32819.1 hypothetical protein RFI_04299 [Reticulomyxa filosa]
MRAIIGGGNNNLLFITYYYDNISGFDLNTFQFVKYEEKDKRKKKKIYGMLLFCKDTRLLIEYDENNNYSRMQSKVDT